MTGKPAVIAQMPLCDSTTDGQFVTFTVTDTEGQEHSLACATTAMPIVSQRLRAAVDKAERLSGKLLSRPGAVREVRAQVPVNYEVSDDGQMLVLSIFFVHDLPIDVALETIDAEGLAKMLLERVA